MTVKKLPSPLIPLIQPYVDPTTPNLTEPIARYVIRTIAAWLDSVSRNSRTSLIKGIALRAASRLLYREAARLIPPERPNASLE